MNIEPAANPAAEAISHGQSAREATGATRAMFYSSASALPMLRGPMVAYAPEDDSGAPADNGGSGGDASDVDDHDDDQDDFDPGNEGDDDQVDEEDDLEDVDFDGKTYKLPKAVREGILRHEDYTKKTMGLAEERKSLEGQRQQHAKQVELHDATLKERVRLTALQDAEAHYAGINWSQLQNEDPVRAQAAWMEFQQVKMKREEAQKSLDGKTAELENAEREADATRIAEVEATLARDIPGWGPELFKEMVSVAGSHGLDELRLRNADVGEWRILHLASIGAKALKQQQQAQRHRQTQQTAPAARVKGGNAPPRGLSEKLGTDEWMKRRSAQVAKAGR